MRNFASKGDRCSRKLQVDLDDRAPAEVEDCNIDHRDALVQFGGQALVRRAWENLPVPRDFAANELEPWLAFAL